MAYLHWMAKDEWEAKGKPDRLVRNFTLEHNALSREYLESYAANYTSMLRMVQSIYPRVGCWRGLLPAGLLGLRRRRPAAGQGAVPFMAGTWKPAGAARLAHSRLSPCVYLLCPRRRWS